jgi:hypothetical protein
VRRSRRVYAKSHQPHCECVHAERPEAGADLFVPGTTTDQEADVAYINVTISASDQAGEAQKAKLTWRVLSLPEEDNREGMVGAMVVTGLESIRDLMILEIGRRVFLWKARRG